MKLYAYILTEEGRAYSDEGIQYIINQIRSLSDDQSIEIDIRQGISYNNPTFLYQDISEHSDNIYIFVSHDKGIEILHTITDIEKFCDLLKHAESTDNTWSIIMHALGLCS